MKFETPTEALLTIFGYAGIVAHMLDLGFDPLIDTDVREFMEGRPESQGLTEEQLQASVDNFYEIHDFILQNA